MSLLYNNGNVPLIVVLHLPAGDINRGIECAAQSQNRPCHSNIIQNSSTFNVLCCSATSSDYAFQKPVVAIPNAEVLLTNVTSATAQQTCRH